MYPRINFEALKLCQKYNKTAIKYLQFVQMEEMVKLRSVQTMSIPRVIKKI